MIVIKNHGKRPLLAAHFLFGLHQVGFDESVEVSIHDRLHIAHFKIGPVVLDHFIGMEYVGPYL